MDKMCEICLAYTVRHYPEIHGKCLLDDTVSAECLQNNHKYFESVRNIHDLRTKPTSPNKPIITTTYDMANTINQCIEELSVLRHLSDAEMCLLYELCHGVVYKLTKETDMEHR